MRRLLARPEYLFLIVSLAFGLLLTALIPPLGAGDEKNHFQRLATIASMHVLNEKAMVPAGITHFINFAMQFFLDFILDDRHYTSHQYEFLAGIPIDKGHLQEIEPNYITVHHPLCYIPQVLAYRVGMALGCRPLVLLYLARLAGLFASIALSFFAIRRMPSHRYAMCALMLLPTITFFRSHLNADSVMQGICFLFIACTLHEIVTPGEIRARNIFWLALMGWMLAQCKSTYFVLLFLTLLIPAGRFRSLSHRIGSLAAIILPGMCFTIAWMIIIKKTYFVGVHYHTWGGDVAPDDQSAFITQHPFTFLKILAATIFTTSLVPECIMDIFGDFTWGTQLAPVICVVLMVMLLLTQAQDQTGRAAAYPRSLPWLVAAIFVSFFALSLVIFYIQWTGVGEPIIKGFQGRYFIPLLPLLPLLMRPLAKPFSISAGALCLLLGTAGLTLCIITVSRRYFG